MHPRGRYVDGGVVSIVWQRRRRQRRRQRYCVLGGICGGGDAVVGQRRNL
jgi:hypothetical protein